ncbi:HEAT repeat domain-containing protein [Candidatus Poribacteria bacterium]|nr:HEAT repeat domain-containing protein [Candidatus Poribacteria bacterium]
MLAGLVGCSGGGPSFGGKSRKGWEKALSGSDNSKAVSDLAGAGPEAAPLLANLIQSENAAAREGARMALAQSGGKSVPGLVGLLKADLVAQPGVAYGAARALGAAGPVALEAADELAGTIETTSDQTLRGHCMDALTEIGADAIPVIVPHLESLEMQQYFTAVLGNYGRAVLPALSKALGDPSPNIRVGAATVLTRMFPRSIVLKKELMPLLKDPDLGVRLTVTNVMGRSSTDPADTFELLSSAMDDPSPQVRAAAASGLSYLGRDALPALPKMIETLGDLQNTNGIQICINAVGDLGPDAKDAVPALVRLLRFQALSIGAVNSIGEIGPPAKEHGSAPLLELLQSPDGPMAGNAAMALARMQDERVLPKIKEMLESEHPFNRSAAAKAIGWGGEMTADLRPRLETMLADADSSVKAAAGEAIARIEGPGARERLKKALTGDPVGWGQIDLVLREVAGSAPKPTEAELAALTAEFAGPGAGKALAALTAFGPDAAPAAPDVAVLLESPDWRQRVAASDCLASIGDGAVPALEPLLASKNEDARELAALTLIEIAHKSPEAAAVLGKYEADPNEVVRWAALRAKDRD